MNTHNDSLWQESAIAHRHIYPPLPKPANQTTTRTKAPTILLLLCAVFVIGLSAIFLRFQSLRLDEAQSLWQSSHSLSGILFIVAGDVHVPFYHLILHFWQLFFGSSVLAGRMLSLIFWLATIPLVYLLGKRAFSRPVGLLGAILATLSPFLNWYGNEIRMYSLLTLLAVLNHIFFIKIFKNPSLYAWWGYGITAILGVYTHYFFLFLLGSQGLFYLIYNRSFRRKTAWKLGLILVLVALSLVPWLWYVEMLGFAATTQPVLKPPTSINFFNTYAQFLFGFQSDHLNTMLVSLWPITVLLAFLTITRHKKIPKEAVYFLITALLPVLAAFVISIFWRPLYVSRYLILTVPSLYLFLSWVLFTYTPRIRALIVSVLIIVMLGTLAQQTASKTTPVKEDYREAARTLSAKSNAKDIIVVSAPFTIYPLEYYYRGPAQIVTLPIWDRYAGSGLPIFDESKLPEQIEQIKGDHENLYLILSYDQGYETPIHQYFETHFQRIDKQEFSPGLNMYVYKLRYSS